MAKIDYAYKAQVLSSYPDFLKIIDDYKKIFFYGDDCFLDDEYKETVFQAVSFLYHNDNDAYHELFKINAADYQRKKRLRNRISFLLSTKNCKFVTLSFTDEVLSSTNSETRRKYVRRFLRDFGVDFVANIDFSPDLHREHYHACVVSDYIPPNAWKYGFSKIKKVRSVNDYKKLAAYISKLTNHAIKETAKGSRIIYSRFRLEKGHGDIFPANS